MSMLARPEQGAYDAAESPKLEVHSVFFWLRDGTHYLGLSHRPTVCCRSATFCSNSVTCAWREAICRGPLRPWVSSEPARVAALLASSCVSDPFKVWAA